MHPKEYTAPISSLLKTLKEEGFTFGQTDRAESQIDMPTAAQIISEIATPVDVTLVLYKKERQFWILINTSKQSACDAVKLCTLEIKPLVEDWKRVWEMY